jgi:hypothetical protein
MPHGLDPHVHEPDQTRRLLIDAGIAVATVLSMALLWHMGLADMEGAGRGTRGMIALLLAVVFGELSGVRLFRWEESVRGLPLGRFATAAASTVLLAIGTFDLLEVSGLPLEPLGPLLVGGALLLISVWSDSVLAALVGAEFLDDPLADMLAGWFGFAGGIGTQAIFFTLGVALLQIPLGYFLARRFRRSVGVGVMGNAGLTLTTCFLLLGSFGPAYHDRPDWTWLSPMYFTLAVLVSIGFVRLIRRFTKGAAWDLSSRGVIITLSYIASWVGIPGQTAWLVGMMGYWVMESSGIFDVDEDQNQQIQLTPDVLNDPERLQELLAHLARVDPTTHRFEHGLQLRWVRASLALSTAGALMVWGAGALNQGLPSAEAVRLEVLTEGVGPVLKPRYEELHMPDGLQPGGRVDLYLTPYGVDEGSALFTDMHVVAAGEPPPDDVDPPRTWKLHGRYYDCRDFRGRRFRGVRTSVRVALAVPEEDQEAAQPGDQLVLREGALGFPFVAGRIVAGDDGARAALGSWLWGAPRD